MKKWYYIASATNMLDMGKHFAIIDEDDCVVVGMAGMAEEVAREIVQSHNEKVDNKCQRK